MSRGRGKGASYVNTLTPPGPTSNPTIPVAVKLMLALRRCAEVGGAAPRPACEVEKLESRVAQHLLAPLSTSSVAGR